MIADFNDTGLSKVCEVITARTGLHFSVDRWAMLGRNLVAAARESGFYTFDSFIQWLLTASLNKDQVNMLAAHLTISETYFWREPQAYSALMDFVLPQLIASKKNRDKCIRIWSAGCSTGEEPYSLAIALHRTIPNIKDWSITILATDINPKALAKAEEAVYSTWSFRNCPSWLTTGYFHPLNGRRYKLIPEIREMVAFSNLNLTEDIYSSPASNTQAMDIIFCRNVLMYFTNEWVGKISQNLFHSLSKEGWFVVSSCELSSQVFPQFTPVNFPGAIFYRKGNNPFSPYADVPAFHFRSDISIPETSQLSAVNRSVKSGFTVDSPATAAIIYKVPVAEVPPPPPLPDTADRPFTIRELANQGNLPEALLLCDEGIAKDKLSIVLYFLRASILQELDKNSEAIASLKQTIYLDPDFIMGHFTLGNLFIRQGKPKNAIRYFHNVLDLLRTCADDDILPESEGLPVKYIREIVLANLQTQRTT